jgi:tetratricopeptide (TPR) repeat protein
LDDRFRLLAGGNRTAPPRHQTLRALIDWSYDLLPPTEQRLLRRLSVFAGGFSLAEVEAIGDEEGEGGVLDRLTQLVNKSLMVAGRVSGERTRYTLHETIRQYGLERLAEEGAVEPMRDRHAAYYCRLAEEAEPQLYQAGQLLWMDRLEEAQDNLRAALNWTLVDHPPNAATGLRLAAALANYWEMRGILVEGHRWLTAALEKVNSAAVPLQASFYLNAGNFWLEHGGRITVVGAKESLALYQRLEDEKGIAWALRLQGNCALFRENDLERATVLYEQGLALAEEVDDKALISRICQNLGQATMYRGDLRGAARLGEKGLALALETGDRFAVGYLSFQLGITVARQGDYTAAEAFLLEALAVCRELKLEVNAIKTLTPLGEVLRVQKKYDQAVRQYQEHLRLARGMAGWETAYSTYSTALAKLGHVTIRQGDPHRATNFFRESIAGADREDLIWALWGLGLVGATLGRFSRATRLYAAADQLIEADREIIAMPEDREEYKRDIAHVRDRLGEAEFAAAWAAGRAMSLEEAIAYALAATGPLATAPTVA